MIPQRTEINFVETSEDFQELTFGVREKDMGLILEILRSKLYSNPVASICREISSNSRDANREAGNKDPIEIAMQDSIWLGNDLCIAFKDNGPGISPSRIADVFVNYGASTKRDDNVQTGTFGIGAKTPFSYTDNFAIITVVDGIEYAYTAAIDEGRRGKLFLCNKKETTEPNGTTILVPVKSDSDREEFEMEVYRATYFWSTRPKYVNFKTTLPEVKFLHQHETGLLIKQDITNSSYNLLIDGIIYPLDSDSQLKFVKRYSCCDASVFLEFKIGELTISANRESVQYDKPTVKAIEDRFKEFKTHLASFVNEQIKTSPNYFQACIRYSQMYKESFELQFLASHSRDDEDEDGDYKIEYGTNGDRKKINTNLNLRALQISVVKKDATYKKRPNKSYFDSDFLAPIFFLDRATSTPKNRTIFEKNNQFLLIEFHDKELYKWSELPFKNKKRHAEMMRKALSEIEFLKSIGLPFSMYSCIENTRAEPSTIPKEEKPIDIYTRVAECREFQSYTLTYDKGKIYKHDKKELDKKESVFEPLKSLRDPEYLDSELVQNLRKWAYLLSKYSDITVYFVNEVKGSQYFTSGNYPRLQDVLKKLPAKVTEQLQQLSDYNFSTDAIDDELDVYKKITFQDEAVKSGLEYIGLLQKEFGSTHGRQNYCLPTNFQIMFPVSEKLKAIRKSLDSIKGHYPLLQYLLSDLRYSHADEALAHVNKYIRLVDDDKSRLLPVVIEQSVTQEVKEAIEESVAKEPLLTSKRKFNKGVV